MDNTIDKAKLPKGMSYILKTSELQNAMAGSDTTVKLHINYRYNKIWNRVFDCKYWLPNANVDHRRLYVTTLAVRVADKQQITEEFLSVVLPQFIKWVDMLNALPDNSSFLKRGVAFTTTFINEKLLVVSEPVVA